MVDIPMITPVMFAIVVFFEIVGVAVILGGFLLAVGRGVRKWREGGGGTFDDFRTTFGKSILLGLEVLIAADLIRTITVELTLYNLGVLAALIAIRTGLSFSLDVEIDGRWPWQRVGRRANV